jgi:homogentisate 1,2-dioxygenase
VLVPTKFALDTPALQKDYDSVWAGFAKNFKK